MKKQTTALKSATKTTTKKAATIEGIKANTFAGKTKKVTLKDIMDQVIIVRELLRNNQTETLVTEFENKFNAVEIGIRKSDPYENVDETGCFTDVSTNNVSN